MGIVWDESSLTKLERCGSAKEFAEEIVYGKGAVVWQGHTGRIVVENTIENEQYRLTFIVTNKRDISLVTAERAKSYFS